MSIGWAHALIAIVIGQRLAELAYSRRNARALIARGGKETGAGHYPLFIVLHAAWLAALTAFTEPSPSPRWGLLIVLGVLLGLRVWILASLGPYWTTRIITVDGGKLVTTGPYRYLRHPNYMIVAFEMPVLSMALDLPWVALAFGLANGALLLYRISMENAALERAGRSAAASG